MKTYDAEARYVRENEGKALGGARHLAGVPLPNGFCFLVSRTDGAIIEPAFDFLCSGYLTIDPKPSLKRPKNTIDAIVADLADFHHYLDSKSLKVSRLTKKALKSYALDLTTSKSAVTGKNLSKATVARRWSTLTKFIAHCLGRGFLKNNIPIVQRETKRGTCEVLDLEVNLEPLQQSGSLVTAVDPETLRGVLDELGPPIFDVVDLQIELCAPSTTDRLMAEVAWNTGLRRTEVCNLRLNSILTLPRAGLDPLSKLSIVIVGKGKKSRSVPFPVWLIDALERYARITRAAAMELRLAAKGEPDHGYLFVHEVGNTRCLGDRISPQTFDRHFAVARRSYLEKISKWDNQVFYQLASAERITVHALRHTFAITAYILRRNAGDPYPSKHLAGILGHASVETTEGIYLRSVEAFESKIRERVRLIHEQLPHMRLGAEPANAVLCRSRHV